MNAPIQQFNLSQIAIIDHNGGKWLTAEQLGLALGFSQTNARIGVNKLYNRHIDEFSKSDSTVVKTATVDGKLRETRIFSHSGCNLLSFFANTPNAKAFRAWQKKSWPNLPPIPPSCSSFRRPIWKAIPKRKSCCAMSARD
ncbi:BRO-N domain-containing protein [Neisseria yangbaofengii]|uniref:BRO-N domain-containing protein n=1 Tax=Neisseria yangbaofengii TaxID=2709396 RepID=UPI0013EC8327|nr:Bro-N domain-containing protein [Neisseria yangbaofengii]